MVLIGALIGWQKHILRQKLTCITPLMIDSDSSSKRERKVGSNLLFFLCSTRCQREDVVRSVRLVKEVVAHVYRRHRPHLCLYIA